MDFQIPVSQPILNAVAKLDRLRGTWQTDGAVPAERLDRMREAAQIQSVAASCRLSGIRLSDAEVAGLLQDRSVPLADAAQIRGYAEALSLPFPASSALLSSDDLRRLHAILIGGDAATPSPWRTAGHYHREAFDRDGRATGRVFSALPSHLIQDKVDELLTWMEFELRTGERHPVLVIGTFILGLHAASPFDCANSRLARVLIPLLLRRAGYGYVPYASIEAQIEDLRDEYHESYDLSQTHVWKGDCDLGPWLDFFLEVLSRQRERVESKMLLEREASAFPPLQQAILDTVREHGSVDAGLLMRATGANRNTLKDNLRRLVDRGALEKTGQRRGTRYRLAVLDEVRR